jgi:hypothetical protein
MTVVALVTALIWANIAYLCMRFERHVASREEPPQEPYCG